MTAQESQVTDLGEWRTAHGQPQPTWAWDASTTSVTTANIATANIATAHNIDVQEAGASITVGRDGPTIAWSGRNPDELWLMAQALLDGARAARNGDDINAVARQEWRRRGGRPDLD